MAPTPLVTYKAPNATPLHHTPRAAVYEGRLLLTILAITLHEMRSAKDRLCELLFMKEDCL